jgi:2-polyprenyl-6-methoxyphenol hydroxylase-like FAD-dependent oxidoreductase
MIGGDASQTDVLVVGSGPVGLMVAGELAHRGVSVRIIDRAPQRSPQSRALVVHARTLEVMDLAGLGDTFVEHGYPAPGLNVGLGGSGHEVSVDMRVLDTRYPFMLVLPSVRPSTSLPSGSSQTVLRPSGAALLSVSTSRT